MSIPIHIEFSRALRKHSTPEEEKIWNCLRNRKFQGLKFTRQYPIEIFKTKEKNIFYIADFYCASLKLILEIDGEIHNDQKVYDAARDKTLSELGFKVVRIKNININDDIYNALKKIKLYKT
jgi:leucyl-tRNA synthetase